MRALFASAIAVASVVVAGCGGSSSETPWPVEPEGVNLGPAGEAPTSGAVNQAEAPDAGAAERPPAPAPALPPP